MTCLPQGFCICSVPCLEAFALDLGLYGSSSSLVSVQIYLLREAFLLATLLYTLRTLITIQHDPIYLFMGFLVSYLLPPSHWTSSPRRTVLLFLATFIPDLAQCLIRVQNGTTTLKKTVWQLLIKVNMHLSYILNIPQ